MLAGQTGWERTELCPGGFKPGEGFDLTGPVFLLALRHVFLFFTFLQKREPQSWGVSIHGSPNPLHQYGQTDGLKIGFWGNILCSWGLWG